MKGVFKMTNSVIKSIFVTGANRVEANIKNKASEILAECQAFSDLVADLKSDAMRKAILADKRWSFLYDEKSEKGKLVMSARMRQVKGAMSYILENADSFTAWAEDDSKTGVTSLRGIKDAIKPKKGNGSSQNDDDETASDETGADDADETISENEPVTREALYAKFLTEWKNAGFGDSIAFDQYVATDNAGKVADEIDAVA